MVIKDGSCIFLSKLLITFQEYQITDFNRDMSVGHRELLQADRVSGGTGLPPLVKAVHSRSWQLFTFHHALYVFNFILNSESVDTECKITNKSLTL